MQKFTIHFRNYASETIPAREITAAYYKREDGWITFKDEAHKTLLDVTADDVRVIQAS